MSAVSNVVSVYDDATGRYSYYRVPSQPGRSWTMPRSPLGTPVQDALPPLPVRAQRFGHGPTPLGTIVRGSPDWKEPALKLGAVALGVYVLGRLSGLIPPFRRHHGA